MRVVVCEDSRTYASALTRMLEADGDITVVGTFATAEQAIAALARLDPDLVTMDIELPGMSGLEAVEQIMGARPVPILVLSSHVGPASGIAAAALAAGALEAVAKDDLDLREPGSMAARAFRHRAKLLSSVRVIRHPRARLAATRPRSAFTGGEASVIGMCSSTGGPQALVAVLGTLPASYAVPILVVQHMAAGFTSGLATWLNSAVDLPVRLAAAGDRLATGVTVAPEGAHLVLGRGSRLKLDRESVAGLHRPSADALLCSIAEAAGAAGVGVVLTGMGRDGAIGIRALRAAGGTTIAQDEATSVVYGMPKAAAEEGAQLVLPLDEIPAALAALRSAKAGRA